jgi:hypothetical protein
MWCLVKSTLKLTWHDIVDVHNLGSNNVLLPNLNFNDIIMLVSLTKE